MTPAAVVVKLEEEPERQETVAELVLRQSS